jgi:hypothetical protein
MFELLSLLQTSSRTISDDLRRWFEPYPEGGAYYVVSDYGLNDETKQNDVFAFEIILAHDKLAAISDYIGAVAPRDIKKSRKASRGLGQYLVSPVTFSVSFVMTRSSRSQTHKRDSQRAAGLIQSF